jgi:hypothetical protein
MYVRPKIHLRRPVEPVSRTRAVFAALQGVLKLGFLSRSGAMKGTPALHPSAQGSGEITLGGTGNAGADIAPVSNVTSNPDHHDPASKNANDESDARIRFVHHGAQVEITAVLLSDDRALFTALDEPAAAELWTDIWIAAVAGSTPIPAAMASARARVEQKIALHQACPVEPAIRT